MPKQIGDKKIGLDREKLVYYINMFVKQQTLKKQPFALK